LGISSLKVDWRWSQRKNSLDVKEDGGKEKIFINEEWEKLLERKGKAV
jgi:hypothetical protein